MILIPIAILILIAVIIIIVVKNIRRKKKGLPKKEGMFKDLKGFLKKDNKDLRKRLYLTVGVLTIYIIGMSQNLNILKKEINFGK